MDATSAVKKEWSKKGALQNTIAKLFLCVCVCVWFFFFFFFFSFLLFLLFRLLRGAGCCKGRKSCRDQEGLLQAGSTVSS